MPVAGGARLPGGQLAHGPARPLAPGLPTSGGTRIRTADVAARAGRRNRVPSRPPPAAIQTAPPAPEEATEREGAPEEPSSPSSRVRAVAAKISAARELARRLAEEKQAAVAAGLSESADVRKFTEAASSAAAFEAARKDAMARAAKRAEQGKQKDQLVERLRVLNTGLRDLVMQFANDSEVARSRIAELERTVGSMLAGDAGLIPVEATPTKTEIVPEVQKDVHIEESLPAATPLEAVHAAPPADSAELLLRESAQQASSVGNSIFTLPQGAVNVGKPVRIFYDCHQGPLPSSDSLILKFGVNRWESIQLVSMTKCTGLSNLNGSEWWEANLTLPRDMYRFDFVVMDKATGLVDNNHSSDFQLELKGAPTEEELLEKAIKEFEKSEEQRDRDILAEMDRLRKRSASEAKAASKAARKRFQAARQEDMMAIATASAGERRAQAVKALANASQSMDGIVQWVGGALRPASRRLLAYNRLSGPLAQSSRVFVNIGTDNWWEQEKQILELERLGQKEVTKHGLGAAAGPQRDWWGVWIDIPATAAVLNYVFEDGNQEVWDNNKNMDFHTAIQGPLPIDKLVLLTYDKLRTQSKENDRLREDQAAQGAAQKILLKTESFMRRWKAQQEFLYTNPLRPKAGSTVEIYYRPDLTVLRGRPEVYVRGSFNRWRSSVCFTPIRMEPVHSSGVGFLRAVVEVPKEAHVMDLVFSDTGDLHGGFYDSNNGLDFHIPVEGGKGKMEPIRVAHITVEMAPIAKVGGLADVVTALARAVQDEGHEVEVYLPKYDCIDYSVVQGLENSQSFHWGSTQIRAWKGKVEGVNVTFIEPHNGMFWVGCIYGRNDDAARFNFFCGAALEYIKIYNIQPDIVHCHDWQTAPVVWGDRHNTRCVFTIHNLNYGADLVGQAMARCDIATTVSKTYADEVSGHPAVAPHLHKFYGIRNGIDTDVWDPAQDVYLPTNYTSETVRDGKALVKKALRENLNLPELDVPVVGVVTRLTPQKGIHLIRHAAWRTLERGGQFVLLGSAPDPAIQNDFNVLAHHLGEQYPERVRMVFEYNEPLSHQIYAGCDMFLVPSIFEPCGLTQMIAMRYGTVPIVRRTGGLNDTVFDVDTDAERAEAEGTLVNGFSFEGADAGGVDYALNRAISAWYNDKELWSDLVRIAMESDWSWNLPASDYIDLYYKAMK
ncbi:unnamed protein product [Ostreobium quekettii]|uniref:starch synthase n=1 Tax=Ostreobium quekettii TaxID=121088 RepID=A0A8S1J3R9_9CHLO|nr:unnamed protein product [Ostreobium quekettii]|eukprot:evm.model.scf_1383EXC.3 EVM.evm.TU.scf_1383EXC.3   scf_1383EXC:28329-38352(-)